MVAKASIKKSVVITFPPGESVVQLDLKTSNELTPGCIPSCVTELHLTGATVIKPGVITEGITHLRINTFTKDMHIPETVKYLLIDSYNGRLPTFPIENLFIHRANACGKVVLPAHYVFHYPYKSPDTHRIETLDKLMSSYEPLENQTLVTMFGEEFWVLKSVEMPVATVKVVTPKANPVITALLEKRKVYLLAKQVYIEDEITAIDEEITASKSTH